MKVYRITSGNDTFVVAEQTKRKAQKAFEPHVRMLFSAILQRIFETFDLSVYDKALSAPGVVYRKAPEGWVEA